jgi:hypothetical protein
VIEKSQNLCKMKNIHLPFENGYFRMVNQFREAYQPNVCCNVCFTTDCYGKFREAYHPNVCCNVCLFCVVFNCFVFFIMCLLFNVLPMSLDRLFLVAHSIFPYIKYVNIFKRFFPTTFVNQVWKSNKKERKEKRWYIQMYIVHRHLLISFVLNYMEYGNAIHHSYTMVV